MEDDSQNIDAQVDPIIGTPNKDTGTWDGAQSYQDTCAIRCQEFILEQFSGQEIDETLLVQSAMDNGWYAPGVGTPPEHLGNLLDMYGVSTNRYANASPYDLASELAQGHKVIIAVDSGELTGSENPILQDIGASADVDGPDHAVVVSGIDTTDSDNPQVLISDPGTGEANARYPLDEFLASWQDSQFTMTSTTEPAPATVPEMVNFEYDEGHIPEIAGISYDEFAALEEQQYMWDEHLDDIVSEYSSEAEILPEAGVPPYAIEHQMEVLEDPEPWNQDTRGDWGEDFGTFNEGN